MFTIQSIIFWSSTIIALIVMGLITVSLVKSQRDHSQEADAPRQRPLLELLWAIAPVILLIVMLVLTYQRM